MITLESHSESQQHAFNINASHNDCERDSRTGFRVEYFI